MRKNFLNFMKEKFMEAQEAQKAPIKKHQKQQRENNSGQYC